MPEKFRRCTRSVSERATSTNSTTCEPTPFQMRNLVKDEDYADAFDRLRSQLFAYLESRRDPRILGDAASFIYAPYFGVVFTPELLQWTPEQQGQELTFEERRDLLRKAYSTIGEIEFFQRMIAEQAGRL